jgi:hypothetical protein
MPRTFPLRLGCAYSFQYPRYNYIGLPVRQELRRVIVESVRDTRCEPLQGSTVTQNPLLKRGRWLMTGLDLDRDGPRSFYFDSMSEIQRLPDDGATLREAKYLVLSSVGRVVCQTPRLHEAMDAVLKRPTGILCKVLGMIDHVPG